MNILFRVDSSSKIGLGHLTRCLVLAEEYERDNIILFAVQELKGNANQKIIKQGYKLVVLNDNSTSELLKNIDKFDIDMVVFDHYHINDKFEKIIKETASITILSLDDTYEKHHCDILLNHNIYANADSYKGLVPDFCEVKCGSEHTLIGKNFRDVKIKERLNDREVPAIFVSFGGSDANNIGLAVLKLLSEFSNILVTLATTSSNQNIRKLQKFTNQYNNMSICIDCNIAELMNSSDLAIITPSVIVYEAMYLKLPFLAVQTANNQRYVSEYLASSGFLLGDIRNMHKTKRLIQELLRR